MQYVVLDKVSLDSDSADARTISDGCCRNGSGGKATCTNCSRGNRGVEVMEKIELVVF